MRYRKCNCGAIKLETVLDNCSKLKRFIITHLYNKTSSNQTTQTISSSTVSCLSCPEDGWTITFQSTITFSNVCVCKKWKWTHKKWIPYKDRKKYIQSRWIYYFMLYFICISSYYLLKLKKIIIYQYHPM